MAQHRWPECFVGKVGWLPSMRRGVGSLGEGEGAVIWARVQVHTDWDSQPNRKPESRAYESTGSGGQMLARATPCGHLHWPQSVSGTVNQIQDRKLFPLQCPIITLYWQSLPWSQLAKENDLKDAGSFAQGKVRGNSWMTDTRPRCVLPVSWL